MGLVDYQFLLESDTYPPKKIKGIDSGFCEPFEELKKSFHCGGSTLSSMGIINYTNYQIPTSTATIISTGEDSAHTGTFILACDFKSYTGHSSMILSGVNTLGMDLYLNATLADTTDGGTGDVFLHYDVKQIIKDGILTINV